MNWKDIYKDEIHTGNLADALFQEQKKTDVLNGWFHVLEIHKNSVSSISSEMSLEMKAAMRLKAVTENLPLSLSKNAVFAGTQNDSFSRSYALIHPLFKVEDFKGYCDPLAVFNDLAMTEDLTVERVESVREYYSRTDYVQNLKKAYDEYRNETEEALFFAEQVTGHLVPDFSQLIKQGTSEVREQINERISAEKNEGKKDTLRAMSLTLDAVEVLAKRYRKLAELQHDECRNPVRRKELELLVFTLGNIPVNGASSLYEAIQAYILFWQLMCLEQCPNPYAFSAGNIDRLFEPYRKADNADRNQAAGLFKSFLAFFNVGDRSWAISQNLLLSGKSANSADLTNETTYAVLDAFFAGRYPQPILSVRLHSKTPDEFYRSMGRFFFTPGQLTPSLFNDDSMFQILQNKGVPAEDAENYAIAGCQEPLITGKDNGNTTNSWLNLAKVLEITLNNGCSVLTGRKLGLAPEEILGKPVSSKELLKNIHDFFYRQLDNSLSGMIKTANSCSSALSSLRVPFLSTAMGCIETGIDLRNDQEQGTLYNGSGCLIHGLSVLADSFIALSDFTEHNDDEGCNKLLLALRTDFKDAESIRQFLLSADKFGNNLDTADLEAADIVTRVSDRISSQKNYLGNAFRPDWSSPSTHLLYGYWTGATPDGRKSRTMLGYGIDPLYGEASSGFSSRILSLQKLPFDKMSGGYASHLGINPSHFPEKSLEDKGIAFRNKVLEPLFCFQSEPGKVNPFYLYVNVTTAETLRKVLANPAKYAPSGVYIMRIHGTFVNFLDLSPAIQEDIILRLDNE